MAVQETSRVTNDPRTSEEQLLLRAVIDNAPFGAHLYSLETDGPLVFIGHNRKADEMLGIDHQALLGMPIEDAFPGLAGTEIPNAYATVARDGGIWDQDQYAYDDGDIRGVFEAHAFSFGENRVAVFFTDVTEKRRLELALSESESRLERATTEAPFPMMIHAEDGEVMEINKAWTEITGYSHTDIPTIDDWTEKAFAERAEKARHNISKLYGREGRFRHGESAIVTAEGETRVWDFSSAPLGTLADGRRLVISTAHDVTARRIAEQKLGQTTRALLTLTSCDEVILHAKDEATLLQGVCKAAVDQGTYRMVWVGYAEHDERKTITPRAFAGAHDGYLATLDLTWGDRETDGPCGLAIRECVPILVRDVAADTAFPCVREAALPRGYLSMAALPLCDPSGAAFGVFVFMAAERDAFDVDEVKLLVELAADLAFGVESLRSEARRTEAERDLAVANERLEALLMSLTETIGKVVEARDLYTHGHEERTAAIAVALAEEMGLPERTVEAVRVAALVHDVGKMAVPTEILAKPGRLSPLELAIIREHSAAGHNILKDIPFEWPIAEIVLQHHERMDGSGYPKGIRGDQILLEARIVAVADVLEAMSSDRPYRGALGMCQAVARVCGDTGKYDRDVVRACASLFEAGRIEA